MTTRLRTWVTTGEYSEDVAAIRESPVRGGSAWSENALAALLVPVGILMGALLAAAMVARLLALPFVALSMSGSRRTR